MKNVTLVIMAAGIGSRLAAELNSWNRLDRTERSLWIIRSMMRWKQDAIRLSLLSEKDIEKDFKEIIGKRIEKLVPVEYAYQSVDELPGGSEEYMGKNEAVGNRTGGPLREGYREGNRLS